MKGFITSVAWTVVPLLVQPIYGAPYRVAVVDQLPNTDDGVAWLFTADEGPKAGKGTTLKFYSKNDLVQSGKGKAWVLELDDAIDTQNSELAKVSRQVRPQRGGGRRGGGRISKFNGAGLRSDLGGAGSGGGQLGAARSGQVGEAGSGGGVNAAAAPDQLPDISGLLGSLPALPALPSLPDLSSIPVIGGLLGSGGAAPASPAPAAAAAPASGSAAPGSIVALTTEVGVIIGDRIGEPIGVAIGSRIGKAIGKPIGSTIGGAIGSGLQSLLPAQS